MLCLSFRLYFKYKISPFQSFPPNLPTYPSHSLLNLCPLYVNNCYSIYTQVYIYISINIFISISKYNLLKTNTVPHMHVFKADRLGTGWPTRMLLHGEGHLSCSQICSIVCSSLCKVEDSWASLTFVCIIFQLIFEEIMLMLLGEIISQKAPRSSGFYNLPIPSSIMFPKP